MGGPHWAASQQRPVETKKVERQAKRENENVIKSEIELELSKEKGDSGTIVKRDELPEKGCRELPEVKEPTSPGEEDSWSDDD